MATVSGYATAYVEKSGSWVNPGNVLGAPDTNRAEYPLPAFDTIAGLAYGFSIPSNGVIKTITVRVNHNRSGGAFVSGTPYVQAGLTKGGEAVFGNWFETASPESASDWTITGSPATFGVLLTPADVDASLGVIYRRSVNADEVPLKSRFVDSLYLQIDYDIEVVASGGIVLSGEAAVICTYRPSGGVTIGGSAILQSVQPATGGIVLSGSSDACPFSPTYMYNCEAGPIDSRVRGAHTTRLETWVVDSRTGLWYPMSQATVVHGEIRGRDLSHDGLQYPEKEIIEE